ncbi:MAG: PAS domain S-box protein [Gammaproteobacteria bacterium]|nr:PAS domain S-box protein [Gammaproteobacteria bacterium]
MYLPEPVPNIPEKKPEAGTANYHPLASTLSDLAEFDALLDAAVDAIVAIDDEGRIIRFNKAAEEMFGYSLPDVENKPLNLLMAPGEAPAHQDFVDRYLRTGARRIIGRGREVTARRSDGSLFPASLSVGEARSPQGLRFVGLIRDLTSQKQAEEEALRHREQLMHASRLTTMGEMAAAMAHELNQPLSAIATYTAACQRLLTQGESARADVNSALREIGAQAHRAGEVIQRMRDFTRSRESLRKVVDLYPLVDEVRPLAELDAKANDVRLMIDIEPDIPPINADRVQVQQVVLNLLRNGVDAMSSTPVPERALQLHAYRDSDKTVRVDIIDAGGGVPDEVRARLFTPFFTTKEMGMGMGLAISRSIITAHGGKLDCCNNRDRGATFYFTLPTALEQ